MAASTYATTEHEVAQLLSDALHLDVTPQDSQPDEPRVGDGLGSLISIDALEIALAISRTYGLELKSDDGQVRQAFASLRDLTHHIGTHRTK